MTVEEYKKEFLKLFQQMQKEHGPAESLEIETVHYDFVQDGLEIRIKF